MKPRILNIILIYGLTLLLKNDIKFYNINLYFIITKFIKYLI